MKSKKDMSAFATSILKTFATNPFQPLNYKQIASRLGITDKGSKEMIKNHLQQMFENDIIEQTDRGKYKLNPKYLTSNIVPEHYVIGIVDMKQTGKAYVTCENGGEDIYINMNNTNQFNPSRRLRIISQTDAVTPIITNVKPNAP